MKREDIALGARLNEYELWREMVRRSRGSILERDGLLMLKGPSRYLRVVMRTDERAEPREVLASAASFFGGPPGYTVVVREPHDADLADRLREAGFHPEWTERVMALGSRPALTAVGEGQILRVAAPRQAADFGRVVAEANDDAERERARIVFERPESVIAPHIAAFVAYVDGEAVSTAMTLASHGVAGVFWVATVAHARRRGLADALTRIAANAGFDLGAQAAWLGASEMGMGLYERIGFEPLGSRYVEYESP